MDDRSLPETSPTSSPAPSPSPSPAPAPADLPPPAEGYKWFVTPSNDFGLPLYAVQVPEAYVRSPSGAFYGNPEHFLPAEASLIPGPALITRVTPSDVYSSQAFRGELPRQGGQLCGILPDGRPTVGSYTWEFFRFTCPLDESAVCEVVDTQTIACRALDPNLPVRTFDGRAAEVKAGDFFFSVLVFQAGGSTEAAPAFDQALSSFSQR